MVRSPDTASWSATGKLANYELGRTLGEGNFGKVKHARHVLTGKDYAVKILDKKRIQALKFDDLIKREIETLKLLRHPNVVRLHEVLASKSRIYMVLEYVKGGELFDRITLKGRIQEKEGRKLFQQLIDAVSYCHDRGVYHRDLKPENVLVDSQGNIKISDFGLSALHQHLGNDGLLHTTCGSPNYVAPEVLANKGYDGCMSDVWSCGVMLYVILTGYLPFDDRNMAVLYQKIFKGEVHLPKWLSHGAKALIQKILDPNPRTRINVDGIKADEWFNQDYCPSIPDDEEDIGDPMAWDDAFTKDELEGSDGSPRGMSTLNAFQLIGMSSYLDLSGFFEKEVASERRIRFTSTYSPRDLFEKIEAIVTTMGYQVQKRQGKLKVMQPCKTSRNVGGLSVAAEVFELSPSLYVVELRKSRGDSLLYRELCAKLSNDLGIYKEQMLLTGQPGTMQLPELHGEMPLVAV